MKHLIQSSPDCVLGLIKVSSLFLVLFILCDVKKHHNFLLDIPAIFPTLSLPSFSRLFTTVFLLGICIVPARGQSSTNYSYIEPEYYEPQFYETPVHPFGSSMLLPVYERFLNTTYRDKKIKKIVRTYRGYIVTIFNYNDSGYILRENTITLTPSGKKVHKKVVFDTVQSYSKEYRYSNDNREILVSIYYNTTNHSRKAKLTQSRLLSTYNYLYNKYLLLDNLWIVQYKYNDLEHNDSTIISHVTCEYDSLQRIIGVNANDYASLETFYKRQPAFNVPLEKYLYKTVVASDLKISVLAKHKQSFDNAIYNFKNWISHDSLEYVIVYHNFNFSLDNTSKDFDKDTFFTIYNKHISYYSSMHGSIYLYKIIKEIFFYTSADSISRYITIFRHEKLSYNSGNEDPCYMTIKKEAKNSIIDCKMSDHYNNNDIIKLPRLPFLHYIGEFNDSLLIARYGYYDDFSKMSSEDIDEYHKSSIQYMVSKRKQRLGKWIKKHFTRKKETPIEHLVINYLYN